MSRNVSLSPRQRAGGMIIRHTHAGRFTTVPNAIFEDTRLSVEAKGVLGYLLSRPPNWQTRQDHLQRTLGIGRKLLRSMVGSLEEATLNEAQFGPWVKSPCFVYNISQAMAPLQRRSSIPIVSTVLMSRVIT